MAEIKLRAITRAWGSFVGVDAIDLEIKDKEFMVFLGPSGCGKTTTMRMIAGLEEPTSGEIEIDNEVVTDVDARDRDVAMVFQSYGLYPNMTVYENISFPLRIRGLPVAEIDPAVMKAAAQVELLDFLQRKPKELSGGQRQRVALARAIVRKPSVFLMDEPLSNLDAKLRVSMRSHIKNLHHALGVTTIYVTHDQIEAMTLADRVVVMSKAEIQQIGTPEDIYNNPANLFVAGFIGNPSMNLIHGALTNGVFEAEGVRVAGFGKHSLAHAVLGVRAEDLAMETTDNAAIAGHVFSFELTGDATLATLKPGGQFVTAKAGKEYRASIGQALGFGARAAHCYVFDGHTQDRLRMDHD